MKSYSLSLLSSFGNYFNFNFSFHSTVCILVTQHIMDQLFFLCFLFSSYWLLVLFHFLIVFLFPNQPGHIFNFKWSFSFSCFLLLLSISSGHGASLVYLFLLVSYAVSHHQHVSHLFLVYLSFSRDNLTKLPEKDKQERKGKRRRKRKSLKVRPQANGWARIIKTNLEKSLLSPCSSKRLFNLDISTFILVA